MKVKNPSYVKVEKGAEVEMSSVEANMKAWFKSNADKESVSFDEIREKYKKTVEQWPDGLIHQKMIDMGFSVVVL